MKILILLVLTSCAFSQPDDYQDYVIEQQSAELKSSVDAFGKAVEELRIATCKDFYDSNYTGYEKGFCDDVPKD